MRGAFSGVITTIGQEPEKDEPMTQENKQTGAAADRVFIFDTTLRDGEQSPGASMTLEEKLQVAELLDTMGVDVIEGGFPIASNGDFESVSVAKLVRMLKFAALRGPGRKTLTAPVKLKNAANPRIHTFISTSPVHMKHKRKCSRRSVGSSGLSVSHARNHTDNVEWSRKMQPAPTAIFCVQLSKRRWRPVRPRLIFPTRWATPCRKNIPKP